MRCSLDDINAVSRVLMDKSVYPFIIEDGPKEFNIWQILENKSVYVFMPNPDTAAVFYPMGRVLCDFHISCLPGSKGDIAVNSARIVMAHMFSETSCKKIFSMVPVLYANAVKFYHKIMREEGICTKSFLKNNELHDRIIFGCTKEDF